MGLNAISDPGVNGRVVTFIWNAYRGTQDWLNFNPGISGGGFQVSTDPTLNYFQNARLYGGGSITFVYVSATGYWYQIGIT